MTRSSCFHAAALFLGILLLSGCRSMGGDDGAPLLPRLRAGADLPASNARLTGTLIRDGAFLRVAGNGNTVVIWPRAVGARTTLEAINVIVVWPATATLQRRGGGGSTVIVWPRTIGSGTPVRVGDEVELTGIVVVTDNISGRTAPSDIVIVTDNIAGRLVGCPRDRGCTGPFFVAREFRPAPAR